jgi:cystathionine beta-lyase
VRGFDDAPDRRPFDSTKWSWPGRDCGREDAIPLWVADMDFPGPPGVAAAVMRRAAHPVYGYTGLPEGFYAAFASWMRSRHGVEVGREEMVFCPGVVPALALAVRAFTAEGDAVVIQPPVYHPFAKMVSLNGRKVVENRLVEEGGRWRMDFQDLAAKLAAGAAMVILCSPHNPVGRVWERGDIERVASLAEAAGAVLVSDEIHCDIVFPPRRHQPALALPERLRRRVVACHAPSKTFNIAGLQASCIVVPDPGLRARFVEELDRTGIGIPNPFASVAAEAAWSEGGPWLDDFLAYVEGNRRRLAERVGRLGGLSLAPLEGSYLAWLDFRSSGIPEASRPGALHRFLVDQAGIWLDEGAKFGTGGEGFARLNLACPRSTLEAALDRLEQALQKLPRGTRP